MPPKGREGTNAVTTKKGKSTAKKAKLDSAQPGIMSFFPSPPSSSPSRGIPINGSSKTKAKGSPTKPGCTWPSAVVDLSDNDSPTMPLPNEGIRNDGNKKCGKITLSSTISESRYSSSKRSETKPTQSRSRAHINNAVATAAPHAEATQKSNNGRKINVGFVRASDLLAGSRQRPATQQPPQGREQQQPRTAVEKTGKTVSNAPTAAGARPSTIPELGIGGDSIPYQNHQNAAIGVSRKSENLSGRTPSTRGTIFSSWGSLGRSNTSSSGCSNPVLRGEQQQRQRQGQGTNRGAIRLPLHVVGLQFRDNPSDVDLKIKNAGPTRDLELQREPQNSHDENAIKVLLPSTLGERPSFVGYVPGRLAALLSPILDANPEVVAVVTIKMAKEERGERGIDDDGGVRNALPAVLEVEPLAGSEREPYPVLMVKVGLLHSYSSTAVCFFLDESTPSFFL